MQLDSSRVAYATSFRPALAASPRSFNSAQIPLIVNLPVMYKECNKWVYKVYMHLVHAWQSECNAR